MSWRSLQLRRRRTRTGRQDRKRSSCPDQASRGSICQPSATKVRRNTPGGCQCSKQCPTRLRDYPSCQAFTLHQVKSHINESWGTSKYLLAAPQSARSSINSGLGSPNCAAPPLLVIARSYRLPNIPSWSDPSTGCTRSRTLEHGEDQLLASVREDLGGLSLARCTRRPSSLDELSGSSAQGFVLVGSAPRSSRLVPTSPFTRPDGSPRARKAAARSSRSWPSPRCRA